MCRGRHVKSPPRKCTTSWQKIRDSKASRKEKEIAKNHPPVKPRSNGLQLHLDALFVKSQEPDFHHAQDLALVESTGVG